MKKYSLIYIAFWLMLLLASLHFLAIIYHFYWTVPWFDNLMHFLGGFAGGFVALWFFFSSGLWVRRRPDSREAVWASLIAVLIVAIAWEIFEYQFGVTGFEGIPGYELDTTLDLIFGSLGAITAGVLVSKGNFYNNENV